MPDRTRRIPLSDITVPVGQTPITHNTILHDPLASAFPAALSDKFEEYKVETTSTSPRKVDIQHCLTHKDRNLVSPSIFPGRVY